MSLLTENQIEAKRKIVSAIDVIDANLVRMPLKEIIGMEAKIKASIDKWKNCRIKQSAGKK